MSRDVQIPTLIAFHLKIFRLFGLSPIATGTGEQDDRFENILVKWATFQIALISTFTLVVYSYEEVIFYNVDIFGKFSDVSKVVVIIIAQHASYFESVFNRHHEKRFWMLFSLLQKRHRPIEPSIRDQIYQHFRFFVSFYLTLPVAFVIETLFIFHFKDDFQNAVLWGVYFVFVVFIRMRNLQFILHLNLIRSEIKYVNDQLNTLVQYSKMTTTNNFDSYFRSSLFDLQKRHDTIFEMVSAFKGFTGWSLFLNVLRAYVKIVVDLYWSCYLTFNTNHAIEHFVIVPTILEVYIVLTTSRNCMLEARKVCLHIHQLKHSVDNLEISQQIQNFSLQLLHQPIIVDAKGLFVLDCNLLREMISSISTYLIFFIQFMPKFLKT